MSRTLTALALLGACAPQQTDDGGVSSVNYAMTQVIDAPLDTCSNPTVETALNTLRTDKNWVGCAFAYADETGVVYAVADGDAVDGSQEMTITTPSALGSVSKPLTAVALLRLWEDGWLGVDDDDEPLSLDTIELGDVLPAIDSWPSWVRTIPLKKLLSHTSGIYEADGEWLVIEGYTWEAENNGPPDQIDDPNDWDLLTDDLWTANPSWSSEAIDLTDEERDLDQPGAAPRVAVKALLPPDNADYSDGSYHYSNVNYLLLGAVIDTVVTGDDFTGYGDYPVVETGYESWTWFVWNEYLLNRPTPTTMALNHTWREDNAAIPGLAADYTIQVDESDYEEASDWGYFGWEGPAGGWTMTIGDLARVGFILRTEPDVMLDSDTWTLMKTMVTSKDPSSFYGLGLQLDTIDGATWDRTVGHGGGIRGYHGGTYWLETDEDPDAVRVAAFVCNTNTYDGNNMGAGQMGYAQDLAEAYEGSTTTCGAASSASALEVAAADYLEDWASEAATRIDRYGWDDALSDFETEMARSTYGTNALDAIEDGDFERAAECALLYEGDSSGSWSCR